MSVYIYSCDSDGKESACNVGDLGSIPELGRSPGGEHVNPIQHSCLENPHGLRSLVGYSPWCHKKLDMTEQLSTAHAPYVAHDILNVAIFGPPNIHKYGFSTLHALPLNSPHGDSQACPHALEKSLPYSLLDLKTPCGKAP